MSFITLLLISVFYTFGIVKGCGVHIHCYISRISASVLSPKQSLDISSLYAGSFFPDWGYIGLVGKSKESELSHWGDFYVKFLELYREKYIDSFSFDDNDDKEDDKEDDGNTNLTLLQRKMTRFNGKREKTLSFILGSVSHAVSDVFWHDLLKGNGFDGWKDQGFVSAVANRNFHRIYQNAHERMDVGGEFLISKFVDVSGYNEQKTWTIPLEDILTVYQRMGFKDVTLMDIQKGMIIGFLTYRLVAVVGSELLEFFGDQSPMFNENIFGYPIGGKWLECLIMSKVQPLYIYITVYPYYNQIMSLGIDQMISESFKCLKLVIDSIKSKSTSSSSNVAFNLRKCNALFDHKNLPLMGNDFFPNNLLSPFVDLGDLIASLGIKFDMEIDDGMLTLSLDRGIPDDFLNNFVKLTNQQQQEHQQQQQQQKQQQQQQQKQQIPPPAQKDSFFKFSNDNNQSFVFSCGSCQNSDLGKSILLTDIDGDGQDDLIISAPLYSSPGCIHQGRIFVISGNLLVASHIDLDIPQQGIAILQGPSCHSMFGKSLLVADLNGDGSKDLIIGLSSQLDNPDDGFDDDDNNRGNYANQNARLGNDGEILIYFDVKIMNRDHPFVRVKIANQDNFIKMQVLLFGHVLLADHDIDGDGIVDLIIGNPFISTQAKVFKQDGNVVICKSSSGLWNSNESIIYLDGKINSLILETPMEDIVSGSLQGFQWFGSSLATIPVDDETVFLIIGAPGYGPIQQDIGTVYIFAINNYNLNNLNNNNVNNNLGIGSKTQVTLKSIKRGNLLDGFQGFGKSLGKISNTLVISSPSIRIPMANGNSAQGWERGLIQVFDAAGLTDDGKISDEALLFSVLGSGSGTRLGDNVKGISFDTVSGLIAIGEPEWDNGRGRIVLLDFDELTGKSGMTKVDRVIVSLDEISEPSDFPAIKAILLGQEPGERFGYSVILTSRANSSLFILYASSPFHNDRLGKVTKIKIK